MRKIVFVGNCQGRRLEVLYATELAPITGDTTDFVVSYEPFTDQVKSVLRSADVIVVQAIDSTHAVDVAALNLATPMIWYPNITGVFLWPFSGAAHPRNASLPHLAYGPFAPDTGDRWLNQKIVAGLPVDAIVDEFLALDVAKLTNLDRRYELVMDRARERDARAGFAIAPLIERLFTREPLFMTPSNPELPLFNAVARGVYHQLGVRDADFERVLGAQWRTPFPICDLPVHPSVARHFGMDFLTEATRYRTYAGENLTLREWAERYVRYEWNDPLLRALHDVGTIRSFGPAAAETLDLLHAGLAASAGSAAGAAGVGYLHLLAGDRPAALLAMRQAADLDQRNPHLAVNVASELAETGDLDGAEALFQQIVARWPNNAVAWTRFAQFQARQNDAAGAMAAIRQALRLAPDDQDLRVQFAHILAQVGPNAAVLQAFADTVAGDPYNPALRASLARVQLAQGQPIQALETLDKALRLRANDADLLDLRTDIFCRGDDPAAAELACRDAISRAPTSLSCHLRLIQLLTQRGSAEAALAVGQDAVRLDPTNLTLCTQLAAQAAGLGKFAEAAGFYRHAIALDWNNIGLLGGFAYALLQQRDRVGAVLAIQRAIQLSPADPLLLSQLADIHLQFDDLAAAECVLDDAIRLAPLASEARAALALVYLRQGRPAEAMVIAEQAMANAPNDPNIVARHAYIRATAASTLVGTP